MQWDEGTTGEGTATGTQAGAHLILEKMAASHLSHQKQVEPSPHCPVYERCSAEAGSDLAYRKFHTLIAPTGPLQLLSYSAIHFLNPTNLGFPFNEPGTVPALRPGRDTGSLLPRAYIQMERGRQCKANKNMHMVFYMK